MSTESIHELVNSRSVIDCYYHSPGSYRKIDKTVKSCQSPHCGSLQTPNVLDNDCFHLIDSSQSVNTTRVRAHYNSIFHLRQIRYGLQNRSLHIQKDIIDTYDTSYCNCFMTLAGLPCTMTCDGILLFTRLFAPTITPSPIAVPQRIVTLNPIQELLPIVIISSRFGYKDEMSFSLPQST